MRIFAMAMALAGWIGPAQAVVGPTRQDARFADKIVMVLKREGKAAGFCTGVVLAQNVVLTAAHCVTADANMRVHFRDGAGKPVLMAVAEARIHPGFRPDAQRTRERTVDLALVRSVDPLPASFGPATLDEAGAVGLADQFLIAGYGVARFGAGETSGVLRIGELAARAPLSKVLLWAADRDHSGAGACTGDSGAPIFDAAGTKVMAITAWADGRGKDICGALTQGTLVAPARGWIEGVMRGWEH